MKKTQDARDYFEKSGLKYSDVNKNLSELCDILKNSLAKHDNLKMTLDEKIEYCHITGMPFLTVSSHYFSGREAISFNRDGFIGFCGWADSKNSQPFINAFIDWCTVVGVKNNLGK